jgi:hypothetical protein
MTAFFGSDWVVIPGVGLSLFVLTYVNAERILGWLKEQSLGNREYVIKKLDMMFVPVDAKKITGAMIMVSFGMGGLFFVLLWPYVIPGVISAVLATVIGWKLPKKVVDAYQAKRSSQFVDQIQC